MRLNLSKETILKEYSAGKSDREIAELFGVDRTAIVHARKKFGIETRSLTGEIGEKLVIEKLQSLGHSVVNMNQFYKTFPFDILVNDHIRIEVKSATVYLEKNSYRYFYQLADKKGDGHIQSSTRMMLKGGRTKKIYSKTCDFFIFVGIRDEEIDYFIIPSKWIREDIQSIALPAFPDFSSKYQEVKNNWDILTNKNK